MVAVNMIIHTTIILACAELACSAYQEYIYRMDGQYIDLPNILL